MKKKLKELIIPAILIALGLLIFKYLPMDIFGENILFDASAHMAWISFMLYSIYIFIKDKSFQIPYIVLSTIILILVGIQRIVSYHHNYFGVSFGLAISIASIYISKKIIINRL